MLDVGCAKGYLLHDFKSLILDLTIFGIDISDYYRSLRDDGDSIPERA